MLFPTLNFAVFFALAFALSWSLAPWPKARVGLLCAGSYVFYGWWDWRFVFLLAGSTVVNFGAGHFMAQSAAPLRRRLILISALLVNLGVLAFFKYANFAFQTANDLSRLMGGGSRLSFLNVVVPVGISFFTFHGISYLVDLYRGTLKKPAAFLDLVLYISFFPQLVAGPIVRASHFLPQIQAPADPGDIRAARAYLLILGGLFKKVVIANYLATDLVDDVFQDPSQFGAWDLLFATYGYALQIYCDFSAYTDIAIGVAALLGFRFPRNFDQPYRAQGLRDFWRRWHISLSSWLRDYLYIPLGGNQGGWRRHRNLLITMLLGGLWHGAAWNFVIWGALHGVALVGEHLFVSRLGPLRPSPLRRVAATVLTFHFVCLTWVFFRSGDVWQAFEFLEGFARIDQPLTQPTPLTLSLLLIGAASQFAPPNWLARLETTLGSVPLAVKGAALGLGIVLIEACGPAGVAPFIYFQF